MAGRTTKQKEEWRTLLGVVSISPVKNSEGKIINYLAVKEDISEHKKSEKLEKALYQISHSVINNENLSDLYASIHKSLADVLPVENLFIALFMLPPLITENALDFSMAFNIAFVPFENCFSS